MSENGADKATLNGPRVVEGLVISLLAAAFMAGVAAVWVLPVIEQRMSQYEKGQAETTSAIKTQSSAIVANQIAITKLDTVRKADERWQEAMSNSYKQIQQRQDNLGHRLQRITDRDGVLMKEVMEVLRQNQNILRDIEDARGGQ